MKKLRTHSQPQSRGLSWLQEKVDQLLKDRLEHLSRLREQQLQPHEPPGAPQGHESPHRHGMTELNPMESPRHRELPPAPPWGEEWPAPPRNQDGASEPQEREGSRNIREWLLYEWDFEDIPPPQHLLEKGENTQKRAPDMMEWPPITQWDDLHRNNRSVPDWEGFPPIPDETKEAKRAKVNTAKSGGRRSRNRRRKKR
ncbi:hypothetical protein [Polycladomyces subterraneus]|uniref:Uncharacterized protein n=1 Tax=Polycladomyces subterraneus TaxID=1016997 RepID=A0ABT8II28_9BACL|nr:hypothetical protein [Polycladomyces subterraneus]MDN4592431.1 hypothetical protein [Polycladomyces subterraneus]